LLSLFSFEQLGKTAAAEAILSQQGPKEGHGSQAMDSWPVEVIGLHEVIAT
jgi:hypothetical protein